MMIATGFWKKESFAKSVLWEVCSASVDTKLRGVEASRGSERGGEGICLKGTYFR